IRVEGRVFDGDREPVGDAVIEIWQADADGHYRQDTDDHQDSSRTFTGFGRAGTDEAGSFWFETVKPGPVEWTSDSFQAPHINVHVFARGLLDHLRTRLYFEDEPANRDDPLLRLVGPDRSSTLIGKRSMRDGSAAYRFDIVLQGDGETVFFEV
ncbi:MAG: protocatechuate 3,4-dioxygenase subunit alpha, partial [Actinomycetota bacterium]|nr:protocatechuate 3,4-dioxygenase subunit alpha [Actinomycetota bacterium]